MRFYCGKTWSEKRTDRDKRRAEWHPFFVLWPRRIGNRTCVWLETVWRKGRLYQSYYHDIWTYDYRLWEEKL